MIRISLLAAALVLGGSAAAAALPAAPDSIGVEYRGNKTLIRHRVAAGETLYGLARRYRVPVEQIVEANAGQKGALTTGQIVLVPRVRAVLPAAPAAPRAAAAQPAAPAARTYPAAPSKRTHKVLPGQTLFGIARLYRTTPQELARLNNFPPSYNVRVGQTLVVAGGAPVAAAPVRREAPAPAPREEPAEAAAPAPRPAPVASAPASATPATAAPAAAPTRGSRPEPADNTRAKDSTAAEAAKEADEDRAPTRASEIVRRVSESGLATSIPNSTTDKYLALHKTAAVGTIMQVRNIMNGQSVYVRVIGQLPDTGENANILVRLSPRAVQRLATPDARFRVETSYVP